MKIFVMLVVGYLALYACFYYGITLQYPVWLLDLLRIFRSFCCVNSSSTTVLPGLAVPRVGNELDLDDGRHLC